MIEQIKTAAFGLLLGASVPVSESMLTHRSLFAFAVESTDVFKYALAGAGVVWGAARMVQKFIDRLDAVQDAQIKMKDSQESFHTSLVTLKDAVREIQVLCLECKTPKKPKTELIHVPTPTKPLP